MTLPNRHKFELFKQAYGGQQCPWPMYDYKEPEPSLGEINAKLGKILALLEAKQPPKTTLHLPTSDEIKKYG